MANIRLGGGVTDIRGSIGGTTFSRGPAGAIARSRVKPINPSSILQSRRRANFSALAQFWSYILTAAERADWAAYAIATNFLNKVGDTIQVSGMACFIRLNTLRVIGGLTIATAAPLVPGQGAGTVAAISADVSDGKIVIAEPSAGFAKSVVGEHVLIFFARPMAAGRTTSPKGWTYVGIISGGVVPPVFPWSILAPYTLILGQQQSISLTHLDVNGRVANPVDTVVAATT